MLFTKKGHFIQLIIKISIVILSLNSVVLLILGAYNLIISLLDFIKAVLKNEPRPHLALEIAHVLETVLIALVMIIFAIGLKVLFILDKENNKNIPQWLQVENFSELKLLLMEAIIASSFIFFITDIIEHQNNLTWTSLIIPISIFLLSMSFNFLKKTKINK